MINGISNTTSEPNFEQTYISGCLEEGGSHISLILLRADLDAGQQTIYDEFLALGQDNSYFNVDNTVCMLAFDRFTSSAITEGEVVIDYDTADPADKTKVDSFVSMVGDLATI